MPYDPTIPRERYDNYGDREWTRLEQDPHGELLYHVHLDILNRYVKARDSILEIGSGSGRYTKDLAKMGSHLTVGDISRHQIDFNRTKMAEFGLLDRIDAFHVLDVLDMGIFPDASFDCVVCIGGVINYLLEREGEGVAEMLRVLKPNGRLIIGSMSFIGASLFYLEGICWEKNDLGIDATRWVFETGIQDAEHYPVPSKHYVHMMRASQMDALFQDFPVRVLERSSAGLFSQAGSAALEAVRKDPQLWDLIVEKEIAFSKLPGTLDCGMNLIYVLEKA